MGHDGTNWELGFKQYSFHHAFQVLRVCNFSAFSLPPAFPPCSCPLAFRHQVRRLTSGRSSDFPSTYVAIQHVLSWRNRSPSLGSPSIKLVWASPNSASSRFATLSVS